MKTDLQVMKGTHTQEVKRFQSDLDDMRSELSVCKSELEESQSLNMEMSASNKSLNDEIDRLRQMQEETAIEVRISVFHTSELLFNSLPHHPDFKRPLE